MLRIDLFGKLHLVVRLDKLLKRITAFTAILIFPLAILLCIQWPLREWFHAYSREANDLAQLLFSIYVSMSITYATRAHTHLTPDVVARRYPARVRLRLIKYALFIFILPWSFFIVVTSVPMVWQSIIQLEKFPESFNPGYFILKIAVLFLGLLIALQAVVDILMPAERFTASRVH